MNYWKDAMSWPIDPDWKCEICGMTPPASLIDLVMGKPYLTWGLRNGDCRCDACHTQYTMRDWEAEGFSPVTTPICLLKPEYKTAFVKLWEEEHRPVDQITDEEWETAGIVIEQKEN